MYDDPTTRQPAWIAISTGFFGTRVGVAPVQAASLLGDVVVISHDRNEIFTSPSVAVSVAVGPSDHRRLTHHYRTLTTADIGLPRQGEPSS